MRNEFRALLKARDTRGLSCLINRPIEGDPVQRPDVSAGPAAQVIQIKISGVLDNPGSRGELVISRPRRFSSRRDRVDDGLNCGWRIPFQPVVDEQERVLPLVHSPLCDQPHPFPGALVGLLDAVIGLERLECLVVWSAPA
jgi:hypothetical protein